MPLESLYTGYRQNVMRPDELLAWCRDGQVTDAKTLTGVLWLQQALAGHWPLHWQSAPAEPAQHR